MYPALIWEMGKIHFKSNIQNTKKIVPGSWQKCITDMGEDGTHGDHITLVVVSQIYNIQFRFSPPYAPGHTANLTQPRTAIGPAWPLR